MVKKSHKNEDTKVLNYIFDIQNPPMNHLFKSRFFVMVILLAGAIAMQECKVNKCDGCPAMKKKVRKATKGSI